MKKRLFAALILGCMLVCMTAGCGSKDNKEAASDKASTASTTSAASSDASKDASKSTSEASKKTSETSKQTSKEESSKASKDETASKAESKEESKEPSEESKPESSAEESSEEPSVQESSEESSAPTESSEEPSVVSDLGPAASEVEISEPAAPTMGFTEADMAFIYNGAMVVPGSDMASALSAVGDPNSISSAPSCIGVGEDKIYSYNGFSIESFPASQGETVLNVTITGAGAATSKGVTVGMTASDIKNSYGTPSEEDDYFISYNTGSGKHLDFLMDGGKIIEIAYVLDV